MDQGLKNSGATASWVVQHSALRAAVGPADRGEVDMHEFHRTLKVKCTCESSVSSISECTYYIIHSTDTIIFSTIAIRS